MLNEQKIYLFGQIQPSQTGGPLCSNTSHYKVNEWSLGGPMSCNNRIAIQIPNLNLLTQFIFR